MKPALSLCALLLLMSTPAAAFKISGAGENQPTVQSAFNGTHFVRSTPRADFTDDGETQVFKVGSDGDELIDSYPIFMRGELHLGWSPVLGAYPLVLVEPVRITSNDDFAKVGTVESLRFYAGGKHLKTYSGAELAALGLSRRVGMASHPEDFVVEGIVQVPGTNDYDFRLRLIDRTLAFDVTTGLLRAAP